MDKKRIKEILADPNTWCWDGCTYIEDDSEREDWEDAFDKHKEELLHKLKKEKRKK